MYRTIYWLHSNARFCWFVKLYSLVFRYDGRKFHPEFYGIGDIPTSASFGCAGAFRVTPKEEAVYIFGGQEDWRNADEEDWAEPSINFSNKVFRLDLSNGSWKELHTTGIGGKQSGMPSARSQSFAFIRKDHLYVYGGYNGSNIFSDLYRLDLSTLEWNLVEMIGPFRPREYRGKKWTWNQSLGYQRLQIYTYNFMYLFYFALFIVLLNFFF